MTQAFTVTGGDAFASAMAILGERAFTETSEITRRNAQRLQARIVLKASTGRHRPGVGHLPGTGPGPNRATDRYIRSWRSRTFVAPAAGGGLATTGEVWTEAPQGRRLENGFFGMDRIGRVYRQPAYPHVGPAIAEIEPLLVADLERLVGKLAADGSGRP